MNNTPRWKISVFLLFGLFLLIPYALRLVDKKLELYPAIIFPSGPGTVKTSGNMLSFYKNEVMAVDESDSLVALTPQMFRETFDRKFYMQISGYGFGLLDTQEKINFAKYGMPGLDIFHKNSFNSKTNLL